MTNTEDAQRKVVIVTGASHGIGAGLVQAFRDRSYCVIANSRSIKPSDDPNILTVAGDISRRETASEIVEQGLRRFGRIDSLVNNAGIFSSPSRLPSTRKRTSPTSLGTSEDLVGEIAVACGYESPAHFAAAFRRHVGVSPSKYRSLRKR
jgi:NAD(P)-dependent dehydrogenase (short-subunit alcohol dehydrogenase family)